MDVKELRIGNWVELVVEDGDEMVDSFEPIAQIQSIDYDVFTPTEKVYFISSSNEDVAYMGMAKPIPLTEEWLVKLGFVKLINDLFEIGLYHYNAKEQRFYYSKDQDNEIDYAVVEHVHQLQNLYFALTGEEL